MKKITKGKKKGFTLIELIAVVAILAILAAIIIPNVINYIDNAKTAAVKTSASTTYTAIIAAENTPEGVTVTGKSPENINNTSSATEIKTFNSTTNVGNIISDNPNLFTNATQNSKITGSTVDGLKTLMSTGK